MKYIILYIILVVLFSFLGRFFKDSDDDIEKMIEEKKDPLE